MGHDYTINNINNGDVAGDQQDNTLPKEIMADALKSSNALHFLDNNMRKELMEINSKNWFIMCAEYIKVGNRDKTAFIIY